MPIDKDRIPQGRELEERYFRQKERDLLEKLKARAAREAARKDLAEAVGVADEAILQTLEELGYDRDVVAVFHLFPLVAVAWADGEISDKERQRILDAARTWGIPDGSAAQQKLGEWLAKRPSATYTSRALRIIRDIMQFRQVQAQADYQSRMKALCEEVASASGGFLGIGGRVSAEERAVLERVAGELATQHQAATERLLNEP